MKHKLPKSVRDTSRKVANIDGKRRGLSQAESELAFRYMAEIRASEMILKRKKSFFGAIEKRAEKIARAWVKKNGAM